MWCGVVWCFFSARRSCSTVREKPRTRERTRQAYGVVLPGKMPGPRAGGGQRSCHPRPVRRASGTGRGGTAPRRNLRDGAWAAVSALALRWRGLLQVQLPPPLLSPGRACRLGRSWPSRSGGAQGRADFSCAPRLLEGRSSTRPASSRGLSVCALHVSPLRPFSVDGAWLAASVACVAPLSLLGSPAICLQ